MTFRIKRVYEPADVEDGTRVLVDRLWPRGLTRARASITEWLKDVAPSTELRRWFDHDPEKFAEFGRRYRRELAGNAALAALRKLGRDDRITLVYGAHDPAINHATVLLSVLKGRPAHRKKTNATSRAGRYRTPPQ